MPCRGHIRRRTTGRRSSESLEPDVLGVQRPKRLPDVLQQPWIFAEEGPSDLRGKVNVSFLLDELQHVRTVEDIEELLEMFVVEFCEALMDREVLSQLLSDRLRPRPMVSMEHPSRVVACLQSVDRRIGRQVGAGERGEDASSRDRL